jgi:hypothetical protein
MVTVETPEVPFFIERPQQIDFLLTGCRIEVETTVRDGARLCAVVVAKSLNCW